MKRFFLAAVALLAATSAFAFEIAAGGGDINFTSTTAQLLVAAQSNRIVVTHYHLISAGTTNVSFEYGTQTTNPCDTGTVVIDGPMSLTAQAGLSPTSEAGVMPSVPPGKQLCVVSSASVQVGGSFVYSLSL
jgi:hypothetical protein